MENVERYFLVQELLFLNTQFYLYPTRLGGVTTQSNLSNDSSPPIVLQCLFVCIIDESVGTFYGYVIQGTIYRVRIYSINLFISSGLVLLDSFLVQLWFFLFSISPDSG